MAKFVPQALWFWMLDMAVHLWVVAVAAFAAAACGDGENTPAATAKEKKKEPKEESEDDMGFCLTIWDFFYIFLLLMSIVFLPHICFSPC